MTDGGADDQGAEPDPEKPDWWVANESLRTEMALPPYRPPRFADGTYTHEVVSDLEAAHDCLIRFMGVNTEYPEDWEVRVDGEPVMGIGRHRDRNGNTVYEMAAAAFEARLEAELDGTG